MVSMAITRFIIQTTSFQSRIFYVAGLLLVMNELQLVYHKYYQLASQKPHPTRALLGAYEHGSH